MFIEPNKPVTVDELLHGMIIQSGNDASITLAIGVAGSEEQFAEMMNKQAIKLGMKATHYMNATGLPDKDHYTFTRFMHVYANWFRYIGGLQNQIPNYRRWQYAGPPAADPAVLEARIAACLVLRRAREATAQICQKQTTTCPLRRIHATTLRHQNRRRARAC